MKKHYKTETIEKRADGLDPLVYSIMEDAILWLKNRKYFGTITATVSTFEEDEAIGRRSRTHREGRAFDLRTWDLPDFIVEELIIYLENKYGEYGAISPSTGKARLVVWHNAGTGAHLHVQISPAYVSF